MGTCLIVVSLNVLWNAPFYDFYSKLRSRGFLTCSGLSTVWRMILWGDGFAVFDCSSSPHLPWVPFCRVARASWDPPRSPPSVTNHHVPLALSPLRVHLPLPRPVSPHKALQPLLAVGSFSPDDVSTVQPELPLDSFSAVSWAPLIPYPLRDFWHHCIPPALLCI